MAILISVCAVLLVKDEADVIEPVVRHMLRQVDQVIVSDNGSTDGTLEVVQALSQADGRLWVVRDPEIAYYQAEKTTKLAAAALENGHDWVIPCDADEWWYAPDGRRIADYLAGVGREVAFVEAQLFNHLPTSEDPRASCPWCCDTGSIARVVEGTRPTSDGTLPMVPAPCHECGGRVEPNPVRRIGWRQIERAPLPKVACRLRPGLEIRQGNHSAWAPGSGLTTGGLVIRHFSWRSEEQFERKVWNGARAYAYTDLPESVGAHWRMYGQMLKEHGPDALIAHYRTWFYSEEPRADRTLIYDPAPQDADSDLPEL